MACRCHLHSGIEDALAEGDKSDIEEARQEYEQQYEEVYGGDSD
jgi:hypothetical protein